MNKEQLDMHNQIQEQLVLIEQVNLSWIKKGSCYICFAYEYFLVGCDEEASKILMEIPQHYYDKAMADEIASNQDLLYMTLKIIEFMSKMENSTKHINYFNTNLINQNNIIKIPFNKGENDKNK